MTAGTSGRDLGAAKKDLDDLGYCVVTDVLTPAEIAALRERLEEQAEMEAREEVATFGTGGRGKNVWLGSKPGPWQSVRSLANKGRVFIDVAMQPILLELMEHIFKRPDFNISGLHGLIVRNGTVPMFVHVDQQIVPFKTPVAAVANAMVTLTEFTARSGATRVLPASHRWDPPELTLDDASGDLRNVEAVDLISVECPAGSAIVFDGRLWHSSAYHNGNDTRYSISLLYCQPWMRQQDNLAAGLHDKAYASMTLRERELFGFKSSPFGRLDPRTPEDRRNTDSPLPFIPELRRDGEDHAVPLTDQGHTFANNVYAKSYG